MLYLLYFTFVSRLYHLGRGGKKETFVCCTSECLGRRDVVQLVACLTSQQHASVSQGRICSDNLTCCHTEIKVADPTFCLTQSQYADTGPTSPSTDPITPGAIKYWYDSTPVKSRRKRDLNPGSSAL